MTNLQTLVDDHLERARTNPHGRSAELLLHEGPLRQTLITLTVGTALAEHQAPPAATLFVLRGRVMLTTSAGDLELGEYEFAAIPHERHGLTALDDAAVVLTTAIATGGSAAA